MQLKKHKNSEELEYLEKLLGTEDANVLHKMVEENRKSAKMNKHIITACEAIMASTGICSLVVGNIGIGVLALAGAFVLANCELATL